MTLAPQMKNPFTGVSHRFPLITAADPGEHKGYALADSEDIVERKTLRTPRIVAIGTSLTPILNRLELPGLDRNRRPMWGCVELQYTARVTTGEIAADSIVKLAFRAGYMVRELADPQGVDACELFAATPHRWKCTVWPKGDGMRKDAFCEKVKRQLTADELELLRIALEPYSEAERATRILDLLDAIGIAWALYLALHNSDAGRDLEQWRIWPDRILPKAGKRNTINARELKKLRV